MKKWYAFYNEYLIKMQQAAAKFSHQPGDELEMPDKPIVRWAWLHTKSSRSSNVPFSKTN